jgi:hypothetical protein
VVAAAVEPDAQQEVVAVAEPDAQQEVVAAAAEPDAQRAAVAEPDAQQQAVAAAVVQLGVRPLEFSVEFAATAVGPQRVACRLLVAAVVRLIRAAADWLWFREELFSAPVLEEPAVSAAKEQEEVDPGPVACRLLAAAVDRLILVAVVGLWSREASFLVRAPE